MCITMCITMCILTVSRCVSRCVSSLYHDVYLHCIFAVSRCVSLLLGCQVARLSHFGGCIPPQIVVYCIHSHGQPGRVDRNNWMYIVTRLSFKASKQKAPTVTGEGFLLCSLAAALAAAFALAAPALTAPALIRGFHLLFFSSSLKSF